MHKSGIWRRVALSFILSCLAPAALAGTVVIYAATDRQVIDQLITDFELTHPDIRVEYHDMQSSELYRRFLAEAGVDSKADVVWSSAMDLQMKLVNDGHARVYRSAETSALPVWARWKDEAFGTTFEPVCIAYNRQLLPPELVPQTHAELERLLAERPDRFKGRLVTYDPHRSWLGYLLHTQDLEANPVVFWRVVERMARTGMAAEATTAGMLDRIISGKAVLGYNALCPYTRNRASEEESIGSVMPRDYTLVMSRIAFISRHAPHPEEAKVWLDYLLSRRGQAVLNQIGLHSVRSDVEGEGSAETLRQQLGKALRPIVLNTGLLTYIDQSKRKLFLRHWDSVVGVDRVAAVKEPSGALLPARQPAHALGKRAGGRR